jgi:hypothetical protein
MESALLGADRETPGVGAAHSAVHRQANIIGHRAGRCGAACRNATSIGSRSSPPARLCSEPRNNANYKEKCRTPKGFGCIVRYSSITRLGKGPPTGSYNASRVERSFIDAEPAVPHNLWPHLCLRVPSMAPARTKRRSTSVKKLPSNACTRHNSRWHNSTGLAGLDRRT